MAQPKLSRKEREYLRHRQEIIEAALDLFSEKGFHNVSMKAIAKESEFAVGTLYKFFSNKKALYKALILEKSTEFHSVLLKAMENDMDEVGCIKGYLETLISVFMNNLKFVRLYLLEAREASFNIRAGLDERIKAKHQQLLNELMGIFKRGIKKKIFKSFDPYLLATALEGITYAFIVQHLDHPDEHPFNADLVIQLFFETIMEREP